jgi:hypothetical protein
MKMKIQDIYTHYQIPENLQLHMYRVTAVGLLVADLIGNSIKLDKKIITIALLLHDVGNIIKFNLGNSTILKSDEVEQLKKVKDAFISKYGDDEHLATIKIVNELNVPTKVVEILENIGSSKVHVTIHSEDWYWKVCSYADFRVAPYGVVSVEERFDDVIQRYKDRAHVLADVEKTLEKRDNCLILEKQIQAESMSPLSEINDAKITHLLRELREFNIA